ncbi:MAG: hypothetical protein LBU39_01405 [Desulfobulbaceae bacterium]|jgi:hypothetical protein|nr:hypothetical protein [Desulfobulbaceae bacterium]
MNRKRIEEMIPLAAQVLQRGDDGIEIMENGTIGKKWRGQLAAFGATVSIGSLLAAAAFFAAQGNADVDRRQLSKAIFEVVKKHRESQGRDIPPGKALFEFVKAAHSDDKQAVKEEVIDAATALKLAMNLFIKKEDTKDREATA